MLRRLLLSALVVGVGAGCRDGGTEPPRPTAIEVVAGAPQTATAGLAVPTAPSFVVKDQNGRPMGGIAVSVAVTAGGGTIAGAPTRTAEGGATPVGTWTLGTRVGENRLTITVPGLTPLTITVVTQPGPLAAIVVASGDAQAAPAGTVVPGPVQVRAQDQFANGIPGQTVTFTVTGGGGTVAQASAVTNAEGLVTVPAWTLGKSAVPQTLRAAVGSIGVDVRAEVQTHYQIDINFYGPAMTQAQQALFTTAAARLSAVVTGDLPDVPFINFDIEQGCGVPGQGLLNEMVDDILIYATVRPIDGAGSVVARAGVCLVRAPALGNLPVVGVMEFDTDDLPALTSEGILQDVVIHEMLHVLGFSRGFFNARGYLAGSGTADVAYTGPQGRQGCLDVGGVSTCATSVPLENSGGSGTAESHWRETTFDDELMTGFIDRDGMPISLMTIGALADLGYGVNRPAFDQYRIAVGSLRLGARMSSASREGWEQPAPISISAVDGAGRVQPLTRAP